MPDVVNFSKDPLMLDAPTLPLSVHDAWFSSCFPQLQSARSKELQIS